MNIKHRGWCAVYDPIGVCDCDYDERRILDSATKRYRTQIIDLNNKLTAKDAEIERLKGELSKHEWISFNKDMPKGEEVVLISVRSLEEHGYVSAWWCKDEMVWVALDDACTFDGGDVDFWMPLPPAPEGEE